MNEQLILIVDGLLISLLVITLILLINIQRIIKNINKGRQELILATPPLTAQEPQPEAEPEPEQKPEPKLVEPKPKTEAEIFKCRKCGKEMPDKKKLQRHIGMAHYKDLEV